MRHEFSLPLIVWLMLSAFELAPDRMGAEEKRAAADPKTEGGPTSFWTYRDFLEKRIPPPFEIQSGHPRLLITPQNKGEILDKIRSAPNLWQQVIEEAEQGEGNDAVLTCGAIYQLGLVPGFGYALSRDQYGQRGVEQLFQNVSLPKNIKKGSVYAHMILPCAYDWLYDLLSDEKRRMLAERMARATEEVADGPCIISGHHMVMGLAFYGDGVDDAKATQIVQKEWDAWWDPESTSKNLLSLLVYSEDSGSPDGYLACRATVFPTLAAWKTATGQDYFAAFGFFRGLPYYLTHSMAPGGEVQLPIHNYVAGPVKAWAWAHLPVAATGYLRDVDPCGAALARWWVDQAGGIDRMKQAGLALLFGLLIGDPRVEGRPPAELDIAKTVFFKGGTGTVYARSSWTDPEATVVALANQPYPRTRIQRTSNALSLWKNSAPLFLYRGTMAHHFYTGGRSVANEVEFYKGGIKAERSGTGSRALGGSLAVGTEIGSLTSGGEAGAYDFMRGQSRQYDGVSQCERTVVYLHPIGSETTDYVVLLDRLRVEDPELTPHVVFQTVFEPRIGRNWEGEQQGVEVRPGHWKIEDAPCVTVTHQYASRKGVVSHARAFLKVLCPTPIEILKIGGEEHFADTLEGEPASREYKQFVSADRDEQIELGGYWRFHVVPAKRSRDYAMVTAIEMTDSTRAEPAGSLDLLESAELLAVQVGPNLVAFSREGTPLDSGSVPIAGHDSQRIVIADLHPEEQYVVTIAGHEVWTGRTSPAGTCLVQEAKGDLLEVRRTP